LRLTIIVKKKRGCKVIGCLKKQEYRERDPILGEFGHQRVYLRRYLCNACGKKFTTPLDPVVERNHLIDTCSKIFDFVAYANLRFGVLERSSACQNLFEILSTVKIFDFHMPIFYRDQRDIQDLTIENIAIERLESLLDKYDGVPRLLQGYIRKKILPDFERLT
jgi:hypothetical protein